MLHISDVTSLKCNNFLDVTILKSKNLLNDTILLIIVGLTISTLTDSFSWSCSILTCWTSPKLTPPKLTYPKLLNVTGNVKSSVSWQTCDLITKTKPIIKLIKIRIPFLSFFKRCLVGRFLYQLSLIYRLFYETSLFLINPFSLFVRIGRDNVL